MNLFTVLDFCDLFVTFDCLKFCSLLVVGSTFGVSLLLNGSSSLLSGISLLLSGISLLLSGISLLLNDGSAMFNAVLLILFSSKFVKLLSV